MNTDNDKALLAWLEAAIRTLREIALAQQAAHVPMTTWQKHGLATACYGPQIVLDGLDVDEAILAEHIIPGGVLICSRCIRTWDYEHDGCEDCAIEPHETAIPYIGICPTIRLLAARYRNAVLGWREEWMTPGRN